MGVTCRRCVIVLALSVACAGSARAQDPPAPDPLAVAVSLGAPPVWKPFLGGYCSIDNSGDTSTVGGGAVFGLYKNLAASIVGFGVSGEGYLGGYQETAGVNGGVRALADLRGFGLKVGVDHDFQRSETSMIFSLALALRRGGLAGRGTMLRVDWIPGRGNMWNIGLQVPLDPHMGRTRPRRTSAILPRGQAPAKRAAPDPAIAAAMREVRTSARGITILSAVFWPDEKADAKTSLERSRQQILEFKARINERSPLRPAGVGMAAESRLFHEQLDLAFGLAEGVTPAEARAGGAAVANLARAIVLDDVIYPYNRLFGQFKSPDRLWGLATTARERFRAALDARHSAAARREVLMGVFDDYIAAIEETRAWWISRIDKDSRLAWLPFPLALRPDEYRTQSQIDAILAKAQGTPLVGGNTIAYSSGQQFQLAVRRTILAAEDYHVLWLHDYDGVDGAGNPDVVGHLVTVEGYLKALTSRVREFDRAGRLPVYMILVDIHYWEANKGRIYTSVLQDPLGARPRLPKQDTPANRRLQETLVAALDDLKAAVAGSKRLQEEAARLGQDWLRKYVAVHLSVMNPADFAFRTHRLVDHAPFAPDALMRDHRKLVFFDLTELDPGKGEVIFGGVGVGEQYATPTWEDRAVRLTGPAALTIKESARRYLRANGVSDAAMPAPLRALPKPADYEARVQALEAKGWTATAAQVHNEIGFAPKAASIASTVLYTLMPPGSLIIVPDSIWTHELWAAYLVGAALRGCHVYAIAPAAANAPSAGFPQMSRTREVFRRFIEIQKLLGPDIAARGGSLRAGLYTRQAGVNDVKAKLAEVDATYKQFPFLKEEFPFPADFYDAVGQAEALLEQSGYTPDARLPEDARARAPKLHRKTQLFLTRDALQAMVRDRRVQAVIASQVTYLAREGVIHTDTNVAKTEALFRALVTPYLEVFRDLPADLKARTVAYMTVGSLNKDARGMMTDGEVLQVTSGPWATLAIADMWALAGSTTWLESQEDLDRLLPPYKEWQRRVARWVRKVV